MDQDAFHHRCILPEQAAPVVGKAIFAAQGLDPGRHLRVAVCGHVGEQMVFDLVAQVTGQDVEEPTAREVAGTRELAQVPITSRFVARVFLAVQGHTVGEMAAEDDEVGPQDRKSVV